MRSFNSFCAIAAFALGLVVLNPVGNAATIDVTTQGSWIGNYGENGYILLDYAVSGDGVHTPVATNAQDVAVLPSFISSYTYGGGAQQYIWEDGTIDVRALQDPANPLGPRKAATSFDNDDFFMDFAVNQPGSFQFSVYGLDWDNFGGRNIFLNVPGDTANLSSYQNGKWAVFNLSFAAPGTFRLDVIDNQPGGNNTISAIAFDNFVGAPEPSAFVLTMLAASSMLMRGRRRAA